MRSNLFNKNIKTNQDTVDFLVERWENLNQKSTYENVIKFLLEYGMSEQSIEQSIEGNQSVRQFITDVNNFENLNRYYK